MSQNLRLKSTHDSGAVHARTNLCDNFIALRLHLYLSKILLENLNNKSPSAVRPGRKSCRHSMKMEIYAKLTFA